MNSIKMAQIFFVFFFHVGNLVSIIVFVCIPIWQSSASTFRSLLKIGVEFSFLQISTKPFVAKPFLYASGISGVLRQPYRISDGIDQALSAAGLSSRLAQLVGAAAGGAVGRTERYRHFQCEAQMYCVHASLWLASMCLAVFHLFS